MYECDIERPSIIRFYDFVDNNFNISLRNAGRVQRNLIKCSPSDGARCDVMCLHVIACIGCETIGPEMWMREVRSRSRKYF